jgi:hypothetical protein
VSQAVKCNGTGIGAAAKSPLRRSGALSSREREDSALRAVRNDTRTGMNAFIGLHGRPIDAVLDKE